MLTIQDLKKFDKKLMHVIYDEWSSLAEKSFEKERKRIQFSGINHIVFSGMGGSGTIGDIFSSILSTTNIHVDVVKGYRLPKTISDKTLIVITSVSGNTAETITVLQEAIKKKMKIISFSSGGKIGDICKKNNIDHKIIQENLNPRSSLVSYLYTMLNVFQPIIPISESEILDSIEKLKETKNQISSNNLNSSNQSLKIAENLSEIPLIYYPFGLNAAAIRFKNSLQENSKMHAIAEDVIESGHNGIVAWDRDTEKIRPVLIQGQDDNIHTKIHWKIIKEFFVERGIKTIEIESLKGDILSKIINLIYILDYATVYRAVLNEVDPFTIEPINYIKERV